jgi:fructose/tagatose bisphosphate aldolase
VEHNKQNPEDFEPVRYISDQYEAMKKDITAFIRLFGSEGKA